MPTLIRIAEVMRRTGRTRSRIYEDMARGRFPKSLKIGDRAIAWVDAEVDQFVAKAIAARDEAC